MAGIFFSRRSRGWAQIFLGGEYARWLAFVSGFKKNGRYFLLPQNSGIGADFFGGEYARWMAGMGLLSEVEGIPGFGGVVHDNSGVSENFVSFKDAATCKNQNCLLF